MSNNIKINKLLLIKVEEKLILVLDKEIPYNPNGGTNGDFLCLAELEYGFEEAYIKNVGNCQSCRKIIATSFNLEGVNHLDSLEELI